MFVLYSKFLPLLVYPLGISFLILALVLIFTKKKKTIKAFIFLILVILWISSTTPFTEFLVRSLEWRYSYPQNPGKADLIVVLGGGTEPAVAPREFVEVNSAGDRIITAAKLFKDEIAKAVIIVKNDCYLAGLDEAKHVFSLRDVHLQSLYKDGESIDKNTIIANVHGPIKGILSF